MFSNLLSYKGSKTEFQTSLTLKFIVSKMGVVWIVVIIVIALIWTVGGACKSRQQPDDEDFDWETEDY